MAILKSYRGLTVWAVALACGITSEALGEVELGPTWRFRITIIVIYFGVGMTIYLVDRVSTLIASIDSQHRASSYVSSMWGLMDALRAYRSHGGKDPAYIAKLEAGIEEQYSLYYEIFRRSRNDRQDL